MELKLPINATRKTLKIADSSGNILNHQAGQVRSIVIDVLAMSSQDIRTEAVDQIQAKLNKGFPGRKFNIVVIEQQRKSNALSMG